MNADEIGRPNADEIGRPHVRRDAIEKVTGRARYAADVPVDGLLHTALVHSRIARGRIVTLDTEAAAAAPGVVRVMTWRNAPRMKPPVALGTAPLGACGHDLPVMQDDSIHWNGEPVAVVLAETREAAEHAASLVCVAYEAAPAKLSFDEALTRARQPDQVAGEAPAVVIGEAEAALASATHQVDAVWQTPPQNHAAIEPHAVTAWWEGEDLVVHDGTQMLNGVRWTLAQMLAIDEARIRVHSPHVGGGFGGKTMWSHHALAVAAAKLCGRPVRLALSREGVFRIVGGRTRTRQRVALGARDDGTLDALVHVGTAAMTGHNQCPEQFTFPARHLYAARAFRLEQQVADLDMLANSWMRAPGESVGSFALESAIDELAHRIGLDPIELRRRIEPGEDPTSGQPFSSRHLLEACARGAERFGWARRLPVPGSRRDGEWLIGMGVATATYPYYRMPGGRVRIRIDRDGRATVATAAHEMGMGTATVQAQLAADLLGLPMDRVRFEYGDTALPPGTIAGGSSQAASIAAGLLAARAALIEKLLALVPAASPLAGAGASRVEARAGGLARRDDPARHMRYTALLAAAGQDCVVAEADAPEPGERKRHAMHSTGAQFCEVRVSALTGEVRVSRFLGSFDCGRILNPRLAASQFRGGIVMGLGLALTEDVQVDPRSGRIVNRSLAEYHVPTHLDVPDIDVIWTDQPDPHSPLGIRGIGEIGITGVGAAVANAVFNATGIRIRTLPITVDKVLAGLARPAEAAALDAVAREAAGMQG